MDLVEYIRLCLVKKGNISAAELARRAGITPQNLSNKFSRNKFSNEDLEKIAGALNARLEIRFIDEATNKPIMEVVK